MGMGFGGISSNRRVIQIKNLDGSVAGTISITNASRKKTKRLQYNFKRISNAVLMAKTPHSAGQAVTKARTTIASLKQKLRTGEYDDDELKLAILHAQRMERVAKKRRRHLEEEEEARQKGACEVRPEENGIPEEDGGIPEEEDDLEVSDEELRELMKELAELTRESYSDLAREMGVGDLAEELMAASYEDMEPEDLERLKKKHRSDELGEIADADMKYLKALFQKLEKERQEAASGAASAGFDGSGTGGVTLELSGLTMPVETAAAAQAPIPAEGGSVDLSV